MSPCPERRPQIASMFRNDCSVEAAGQRVSPHYRSLLFLGLCFLIEAFGWGTGISEAHTEGAGTLPASAWRGHDGWLLPRGISIVGGLSLTTLRQDYENSILWVFWLNEKDNLIVKESGFQTNIWKVNTSTTIFSCTRSEKKVVIHASQVSLCTWRKGFSTIHACPPLYMHRKPTKILLSHHNSQDLPLSVDI